MTAKDFYNMFIERTKENNTYNGERDIYGKDYIDIIGKTYLEIYKKDSDFTNLVNKIIIPQIIKEAGYEPQNEYYRIDTVGWKTDYISIEKEASEVELNPHLWDLKIAVEHENSKKDWPDEVIKLIHVRCPLKIVICYNYYDKRKVGDDEKKLEAVSKWMQKVEAFKECGNEEFLIIIGNGCNSSTKQSDYSEFGYKGYIFDYQEMKFSCI